MDGKFFVLFCIGQVPPCILQGFLAHFSFVYIYINMVAQFTYKKKITIGRVESW